jgi:hypothetical protein
MGQEVGWATGLGEAGFLTLGEAASYRQGMKQLPPKLLILNGTVLLHGRDWADRDGGGYTLVDQNFVEGSDFLQVVDVVNGTIDSAEDADVTNTSSRGPKK